MTTAFCSARVREDVGDIQGVTKRVFSGIREIVCVDEPVNCFPFACTLLKERYAQYGEAMDNRDPKKAWKPRRRYLWEVESWKMVKNLGPEEYDDLESQASESAHALCYTYLLLDHVLGANCDETENLQMACNMLHIGVPLGLLPKMPHPLVLRIF